jgi:glycosyltransferase involved in cell wall biosynthesis
MTTGRERSRVGGVSVVPTGAADPADLPAVSVVVPAFNESQNVSALLEVLLPVLAGIGTFEIVLVDDGSTDDTLEVIRRHHALDPRVRFVALSRNFGHQTALRAGLAHARGACVISMDADLQHPPELIPEMVARWKEGYDVVYTVREDAASLPASKRLSSALFYRLLNALSGVRIEAGTADFRLLSRRVLDVLNGLDEQPFFLRGLVPWLGFRQHGIPYAPNDRRHGQSKYTLRKMVALATDGITSFSVKPLLVSGALAALVGAIALAYSLYVIYARVFTDAAVPGWASVLVAVLWLGSMQLFVLGIMGQYLGKLFVQSKRRPPFVVRDASDD